MERYLAEQKLDGKRIADFTVYPSWDKKGRTLVVSLSLSHEEVSRTHKRVRAESLMVEVYDRKGLAWPCAQGPKGDLMAITGPGTTSLARYVFKEPYSGSVPSRLVVAVGSTEASFQLGARV